MRPNNEPMECFLNKRERVLRVDPTKIRLSFLILKIFLDLLFLNLIVNFKNAPDIFGDLLEAKALHASVFSLSLVASDEVRVEGPHRIVVHG